MTAPAPLPPVDPDTALADIRVAMLRVRTAGQPGERLIAARNLMIALEWLDSWLSEGGTRPDAWSTAPPATDPVDGPDPMVTAAAEKVRAARQAALDARVAGRQAWGTLSTSTRELAVARQAYDDLVG